MQLIIYLYYSDERTYEEVGFTKFEEREKYKLAEQEHRLPTGLVVYPPDVETRHLNVDVCVIGSGAGSVLHHERSSSPRRGKATPVSCP